MPRSRRAHLRLLPWLLVLLLHGACKPAKGPVAVNPGNPSPAAVPGAETIEASLQNGWITVQVSLPRRPPGPRPVVITPIVEDQELLRRGIGVVRFRVHWEQLAAMGNRATPSSETGIGVGASAVLPNPSERPAPTPEVAGTPTPPATVGAWLLAAPRPGIVGQYYFNIISESAGASIPKVIDYLEKGPQVDASRIAITGSSTSGFVALQAMAADPRIAAGVVRVACGDYFAFLRHSRLGFADDPRWVGEDGTLPLDPKYADELRAIQPIDRASRFPPRPLLMLAGSDDTAIPIDCVRRTARRFESAYVADHVPDRFRLVEFQGEGHNLGSESAKETLAWLDRWIATPVAR